MDPWLFVLREKRSKTKFRNLERNFENSAAVIGLNTYYESKKIEELVSAGKISEKKLKEIIERTKKGGAEIVKLLENKIPVVVSGGVGSINDIVAIIISN